MTSWLLYHSIMAKLDRVSRLFILFVIVGGSFSMSEAKENEQIPPEIIEQMWKDLDARILKSLAALSSKDAKTRADAAAGFRQSTMSGDDIVHHFSDEQVDKILAFAEAEKDIGAGVSLLSQMRSVRQYSSEKARTKIEAMLLRLKKSPSVELAAEATFQHFECTERPEPKDYSLFKFVGYANPKVVVDDILFAHTTVDFTRLDGDVLQKDADILLGKILPILKVGITDRHMFEAAHVLMMLEQRAKPAEVALLKLTESASSTAAFHAASALRFITENPSEKLLSHSFWRVRLEGLEGFARRQKISSIGQATAAKLKADPIYQLRERYLELAPK